VNYGKKVKQSRYHHVNQDLYPLKSLMEGVSQNVLKKEKFSWLPKSNSFFLESPNLYGLCPKLDYQFFILILKPSNTLEFS
jgi:hypothetical protein